MVCFQCDSCGRLKEPNDPWILGLAAENIGITSGRREISIAAVWERAVAVDPLAVHFCSEKCRADYTAALFGTSPETLQGDTTVTRRRIKRVIPGAVVDTMVAEKRQPTLSRRAPRRKKTA
jgi:hypothetical protein